MPRPRKRLISLADTSYYHCISRCVRRAFLCGADQQSGFSFEHRRQWIVDRILLLSSVFTIDVCAFAVMSNHYHLVLHVDAERAQSLSSREVATRWLRLFGGPPMVRQWLEGSLLGCVEQWVVDAWIATVQHRLFDISWFMRCLNEPIARMANAEDGCSGRFWEGRFKSQALLDETALLRCMSYVDLNPIRAGMAKTPEGSDYTAVQRRIRAPENNRLMPFSNHLTDGPTIPFAYRDYLELVDWSGRILTAGKQGAIPEDMPLIVQRLKLDPSRYADYIRTRPGAMPNALGPVDALRRLARSFGLKFIHGVSGRHCVTMAPA